MKSHTMRHNLNRLSQDKLPGPQLVNLMMRQVSTPEMYLLHNSKDNGLSSK